MIWFYVYIAATLSLGVVSYCPNKDCAAIQDEEDERMKEDIDVFVEELRGCYDLHGSNIAVVRNGEPFHVRGYGVTERGGETHVTDQTMFCIASTSKAMVGALFASIFSEISENRTQYSWDTPIQEILGDWFEFSEEYRSQHVTVRDLLAHRTGVASSEGFRLAGLDWETFAKRMKHIPMERGFRDQQEIYNNIIYGLASYVAQSIGQKPMEQLLQERILDPLGMSSTVPMHLSRSRWSEFATAYRNDVSVDGVISPRRLSLAIPELTYTNVPGLGSNAHDMARWLLFQTSGGKAPDGTILVDEENFKETHKPCAYSDPLILVQPLEKPSAPRMSYLGQYAIGWTEGYYNGYRLHQHKGSQGGYYSLVTILPALDIGVYTTMPKEEAGFANNVLHTYVLDLLTGEGPWYNASDVCPPRNGTKGNWSEVLRGLKKAEVNTVGDCKKEKLDDSRDVMEPNSEEEHKTKSQNTVQKDKTNVETKVTATGDAMVSKSENEPNKKHHAESEDLNKKPQPTSNIPILYSDMDDFIGTYSNAAYGNLTVFTDNTDDDDIRLMLAYGPVATWELTPQEESDLFVGQGQEPFWYHVITVRYDRDENGDVVSVTRLNVSPPPIFMRIVLII